ncbi:MAG: hypothetical protein IJJ47_07740 [Methanosphaera sp.]|nr:hypothetical protein [Methanosphaera sp.]
MVNPVLSSLNLQKWSYVVDTDIHRAFNSVFNIKCWIEQHDFISILSIIKVGVGV